MVIAVWFPTFQSAPNVEDLQEKLQDACEHPEMVMNMKKQAADFICEKYNWDEVVKETMKLYRRK